MSKVVGKSNEKWQLVKALVCWGRKTSSVPVFDSNPGGLCAHIKAPRPHKIELRSGLFHCHVVSWVFRDKKLIVWKWKDYNCGSFLFEQNRHARTLRLTPCIRFDITYPCLPYYYITHVCLTIISWYLNKFIGMCKSSMVSSLTCHNCEGVVRILWGA